MTLPRCRPAAVAPHTNQVNWPVPFIRSLKGRLMNTKTLALPVAMLVVNLMAPGAALAQTQKPTRWDPTSEPVKPIEQSASEVVSLVGRKAEGLLSEIDQINSANSRCFADAARAGGAENDLQKNTCVVETEGAKIVFYQHAKSELDEISREFYVVAEQYRINRGALNKQIGDYKTRANRHHDQIDELQNQGAQLLAVLDPSNLSLDDERRMHELVYANGVAHEESLKLSDKLRTLKRQRDAAEVNQKAMTRWAFNTEMRGKSLDVDIARSERLIAQKINHADWVAANEAAKAIPGVMHDIGVMIVQLGKMNDFAEEAVEPSDTPEIQTVTIPAPDTDRNALFEALQKMAGQEQPVELN